MRPLDGIRVLDLTQFLAGPVATQYLAWMGAEVIKVEPPGQGEQGRWVSRDQPDVDAYGFLLVNLNKKSVTANLKTPEGRALVYRLVATCDVVVENFRRGTAQALGVDYETVRRYKPDIVYAEIKGFDESDPWAEVPAFDSVAQAMGGAISVTGEPDQPPMRPGVAIADIGAGHNCALGILAALRLRDRTGQSQRVRVALRDTVIDFVRPSWAPQLATGRPAQRSGNHHGLGPAAPAGMYPCKPFGPNDYIYIWVSRAPQSSQWAKLAACIGRPDLVEDPRFATPESRYAHREELDAAISAWTRQHTKVDAMRILGAAGVPAGAVFDTLEISHDAALRRRGMIAEVEHPQRGRYTVPGFPIQIDGVRVELTPSPLVGEHNQAVWGKMGLETGELRRLAAQGII
ncbi:MAG: CoA transferase [Firmicutes bacterium]|nr:CoA transferase [Alicyclobacillaceae bacterium]MCL6498294.1 CoA transferase [Bacillota bacterium]